MSLRKQILEAEDLETEEVDVRRWWPEAGKVWVRALRGSDRDRWESDNLGEKKKGKGETDFQMNLSNVRARLLVKTLVDGPGPEALRLFTDQDAGALGGKNAAILDKLYDVAQRLSGISASELEEAEGNSEGAQSAESISE